MNNDTTDYFYPCLKGISKIYNLCESKEIEKYNLKMSLPNSDVKGFTEQEKKV